MPSDNDSPNKIHNKGTQIDLTKTIAQYQLQQQSTRLQKNHSSASCCETKAKNASFVMNDDSETSDALDQKPSAVESPTKEDVVGPFVSSKKPGLNPFHQFESNDYNHKEENAVTQSDKPGKQIKTQKQRKHPSRVAKTKKGSSHAAVSLSNQHTGTFTGSEVESDASSLRESSEIKVKIDQIPKPKRPLSAYNIFFRDHRLKLLNQQKTDTNQPVTSKNIKKSKQKINNEGHKKIGFSHLAKSVSVQWRTINPQLRIHYEKQAQLDLERYTKEIEAYKEFKMKVLSQARLQLEMTVDSETKKRYLEAEQSKTGSKRNK